MKSRERTYTHSGRHQHCFQQLVQADNKWNIEADTPPVTSPHKSSDAECVSMSWHCQGMSKFENEQLIVPSTIKEATQSGGEILTPFPNDLFPWIRLMRAYPLISDLRATTLGLD